jgi:hypothetical protein
MTHDEIIIQIIKWIEMGKPVDVIKSACRKKWPDETIKSVIIPAFDKYLETEEFKKMALKGFDTATIHAEYHNLIQSEQYDNAFLSIQRMTLQKIQMAKAA